MGGWWLDDVWVVWHLNSFLNEWMDFYEKAVGSHPKAWQRCLQHFGIQKKFPCRTSCHLNLAIYRCRLKKEGVEGVNGPPDLKMHYSTQSRLMHLRRIGCAVHGFTLLISTLSSCLLRPRSCTYSIKLWQHMMTLNDWRLWRIVCLSPDMETQQHFSERQSTYTWFISLHRLMDQWNVTLCQMVPEKNVFKSLQMSLTF